MKDNSGSHVVFTEQESSAFQMKTTNVMDASSMTIGISMDQELFLIFGQVSLSLLH